MIRAERRPELIFDIWERFERHVAQAAEDLVDGGSARIVADESTGAAPEVCITKESDGRWGLSVGVEGVDGLRSAVAGLVGWGWELREEIDGASNSGTSVEQRFGSAPKLAAALSTLCRERLGMRHPWFRGIAAPDYSLYGDAVELDASFDPRAPLPGAELLAGVGVALRHGYGPFLPMMVDGAFLVESGSSSLLIRPDPETAVVRFSWSIAGNAPSAGAARRLAADLEGTTLAQFEAERRDVWGWYSLPADPLVPQHFYYVINSVGQAIASGIDSLAERPA